jgi:hypothetical protein
VHCGYFCIIDFCVLWLLVMTLLLKCFIIFVVFFYNMCHLIIIIIKFCVVFRFLGCVTCFEALIIVLFSFLLQNL